MKATFKVEGLKELKAQLMQFEKVATQKTVVRNSLRKGGGVVQETMSAMAPIDRGDLSENILVGTKLQGEVGAAAYAKTMRATYAKTMRATYGDKGAATKAMRDARRAAKGSRPPVVMFVGPSASHFEAKFIEFGTSPFISGGKFAGAKNPGIRADPFIRPAWDATQGEVLAVITSEMRVQIDKATARLAKRGR